MRTVIFAATIVAIAAPMWVRADAIHAATGIGNHLTINGLPAIGREVMTMTAALL